MRRLTTHVLDTTRGQPASDMRVALEKVDPAGQWVEVASSTTNEQGRLSEPLTRDLSAGVFRLVFDTGAYFHTQAVASLFPRVTVEFQVEDGSSDYHLPLLLSPYGYSTYRGS